MRKPVLPLLFLLFTPIAISAQGFYFPEGKTTWIETGWWQNPDLVGFNFGGASNACQMDRDTLIGGKIYRNISLWRVDSQYTYLGDHFDTTYLNEKIADAGAVRSDSTGRIYYYHYGGIDLRSVFTWHSYPGADTLPSQTDLLFYNFSLMPGDTFVHPFYSSYKGIVDSLGWLNIAGSNRKFLRFQQPGVPGVLYDTWIEGMGSLKGFFSPCAETVAEYAGGRLSCFQEYNVWGMQVDYLWPFLNNYGPDIACPSFTVGIKEPATFRLKAFPNPVSHWVNFEFAGENPHQVDVFDVAGRIQSVPATIEYGVLKLDAATLAHGIYFARFQTSGKTYCSRFFKL